jgi:hypothetical protein
VTAPVDPIAIALLVARALDSLGIIHTIGGSIASSIAGEPRSTIDIDVVAALQESDVAALVHPPEDILFQKLRWYRKGGETSDRQWRDILGIIRVQAQRLDRDCLRVNAPVLGVEDLLGRALSQGTDAA